MLAKLKNVLLEIIFPVHCVGCGTEGEWFCQSCSQKILVNDKQFCPVCWRDSPGGKTCASCESLLSGLRVAASYQRNPELAKAVKTLKYKFSEPLAESLGALLSRAVSSKNYSNERVVTFVPLHKKRRRWRGFNQAELLARAVAENLNLPLRDLLIRTKNTPPQAKLNKADRLKNLEGAFMIREGCSVAGKTILLIDDIASTSSTLNECAKILKQNGARGIWGLVLARG